MDASVISVLVLSAYVIYFMLPAYLANVSALVFGGGKPLDFGRNFRDGRRIIGNGVTWKGTIIGTLIGTLIGILQGSVSAYYGNVFSLIPGITIIQGPIPTSILQGALIGLFLGGGALIGDAVGSFIKRRIGIERGKAAPFLDQLDFVIGALVFASLIVFIPLNMIIIILIISIVLHLLTNMIAYLIGMKDVWY
ncbi:CDP-2,3-bis-(O-geranylgeranyl)-sn-glycerol synthase [Methanobacterium sp. MBAC-LM]|jgi:CDP-2,3-bis-(O-geranylgeranyl)-sn-glycerol synthase|uniref:CDP-2,3-bis-(O-geranylgeranyl)-sn-glycerol synthase n=1 Tax=Methanobacterium sp. MBAC-LM TaxID=3412034 RepID=UPI003C7679D2